MRKRYRLLRDGLILICFVASAIAAARVAVRRSPSSGPTAVGPVLGPGVKLTISGHSWRDKRRDVFLFLDVDCEGCRANTPFYQKLGRHVAGQASADLTILSVDKNEAVRAWLRQNRMGATIMHLKSTEGVGVVVFPTLLIADQDRVVTDIVEGAIDETIQQEFIDRIAMVGTPLNRVVTANEITQRSFSEYCQRDSCQVVDIRGRETFAAAHSSGATSLPLDEISVRARAELNAALPTVIDCSFGSITACRLAGSAFVSLGFKEVSVLLPR